MGHTTDFVGHIDISPALNAAEIEYLEAFRRSRRFDRAGGPYEVPGNPYDDDERAVDTERLNRTAPGQPQLWCGWSVCGEGCCLAWDGIEKFYRPIEWLTYLRDHFLRSGAVAARAGDPQFEHFTFDHLLDGMIVGCRRDTRELFSVTARCNRITTKVLRPGMTQYDDLPPLAYEVAKDAQAEWLTPRGKRRRKSSLRVAPGAG